MDALTLFIILLLLVLASGFFSGSETGMMSLNRYRLRHLARKKHVSAQRVLRLLKRPDRLLGVILIGNTFINILASAIATIVAVKYFGDFGVVIATVGLTLVILIFAETAPKTLAAMYPEKVAFSASRLLGLLLKILYPLVWLVNGVANGCLWLLRVPVKIAITEPLTIEELRTMVNEVRGKISVNYQQMLLRILDLEQVSVDDIMVPRSEIYGIDLNQSWVTILQQLMECRHAYVPLYRDNIDQVVGMLNLRGVLIALQQGQLTKVELVALATEVYFIPQEALLNRQLTNFQQRKQTVGMVVDEYGTIQGLLTMQDVLEEIVGEFAHDAGASATVRRQADGSYLIEGSVDLRDLNRLANWDLPIDGPRTLSGLLVEYLESIPQTNVCASIAGYHMEVVRVDHNIIKMVHIWPKQNK